MAAEIGSILEGKVTGITNFGAFVELPDKSTGMVHISEVSSTFIKDIHEKVSEGDIVKVKVIDINEKGKIALSIKKALPQEEEQPKPKRPAGDRPKKSQPPVWTGTQRSEPENMSFEDMMAKFKSISDDKMSDLKKSNVAKRGASTPRRGGNQRG
ncbi:MAG: S1 RNA-binding domain-containing protein [Clostridia bacterium]|nr:S1 RNA-binding domain-containing protein [Clostridia bacterium]MBO5434126.1 S1 RNA-binding domain-containing protein [Clostridia bacterium]MBP3559510.1 S1 RNA-binding domain-containing protein [Clostridia bacterium]MBQ6838923.1 S1 RNA-binding domain-containing protein [Clostridia bacterium]